jgi:hypothetical protein
MANVLLPLSGNVSQTINPWTWYSQLAAGQIGLVNINLGRSSDPALEQTILDEVGSYGRQIGRLGEALEAVLAHLPIEQWDAPAQDAVADFRAQLREVQRLKHKAGR